MDDNRFIFPTLTCQGEANFKQQPHHMNIDYVCYHSQSMKGLAIQPVYGALSACLLSRKCDGFGGFGRCGVGTFLLSKQCHVDLTFQTANGWSTCALLPVPDPDARPSSAARQGFDVVSHACCS